VAERVPDLATVREVPRDRGFRLSPRRSSRRITRAELCALVFAASYPVETNMPWRKVAQSYARA